MAKSMEQHRERALCRSFFPVVEQRLKMKITITSEFTAIITEHRKTKSYLHRFNLADNPTCPCNEGVQTPEHIIYECKILESQRSSLIRHMTARDRNWHRDNDELVANYLNAFSRFIKSIDFQKFILTSKRPFHSINSNICRTLLL